MADLLVAGIKDHVKACMERAFAPGLEFAVEPGGAGADLGRADAMAAKLLDDFGDLAGLDTPWTYISARASMQGPFAADALFESAGAKVHAVADLRNTELNGADAGSQGLGFEAVGTALTGVTTLVQGWAWRTAERSWTMASLTSKRRPRQKRRNLRW